MVNGFDEKYRVNSGLEPGKFCELAQISVKEVYTGEPDTPHSISRIEYLFYGFNIIYILIIYCELEFFVVSNLTHNVR